MVCQSDVGAFVDSLVGWWVRGQSHRRIPSGFSLVDSSAHSSVDFRALDLFVGGKASATPTSWKFGGLMCRRHRRWISRYIGRYLRRQESRLVRLSDVGAFVGWLLVGSWAKPSLDSVWTFVS